MNGPDHYREAERLLVEVEDMVHAANVKATIGRAQVHATLALAAATGGVWYGQRHYLDAGWDAINSEGQGLTQPRPPA